MAKPRATDEADLAAEQEEYFRNEALRKQAQKANPKKIVDVCENCGAREPGGRFCDVHCRQDFEHRQSVQERTRNKE